MEWNEAFHLARSQQYQQNRDSSSGGYSAGAFPLHRFAYCPPHPEQENLPIRVVFAGVDTWKGECFRYRRNSDTFALELVTDGEFHVVQQQRYHLLERGNLFFVHLRRGTSVGVLRSGVARTQTVSLAGPQLERVLLTLGLEQLDQLRPTDFSALSGLFSNIEHELIRKEADYEHRAAVLAYDLLLRLGAEAGRRESDPQFAAIRQYIESHLGEKLTLDQLAEKFRLSPSTLLRLFRKKLNDTPIHYIISRKILSAQQMLRYSEVPVKVIAAELGYQNALYFSAEFRKHTGVSPLHYRKNPTP